MKNKTIKLLLSSVAVGLLTHAAHGAVFNYDLGTDTGTFDTVGASTTFLPAPPADGGTARVRIGTQGGAFSLVNPGSGSYLEATAATGGSVNKFSIHDFSGTDAFTLGFSMTLDNAATGNWFLFAGSGNSYSNNNAFSGADSFTGIRWAFAADDEITTHTRAGGSWAAYDDFTFTQGITYAVEIFGNNSTEAISYGEDTLAANTWDLWINGTKVSSGLGKALLANEAAINSFMFYGENSTGNAATLILDDIFYASSVIPEPSIYAAWFGLGALVLSVMYRRRLG